MITEAQETLLDLASDGSPEDPRKADLINALRRTGGNQTQAARLLGINRVTVWNRMKKFGIDLKRVLSQTPTRD